MRSPSPMTIPTCGTKYRTWAVLTIEGTDYWVDYRGAIQRDAIYTNNLPVR